MSVGKLQFDTANMPERLLKNMNGGEDVMKRKE